jgi:hypothetical protein
MSVSDSDHDEILLLRAAALCHRHCFSRQMIDPSVNSLLSIEQSDLPPLPMELWVMVMSMVRAHEMASACTTAYSEESSSEPPSDSEGSERVWMSTDSGLMHTVTQSVV